MSVSVYDIIVVGGGPAGSMAALSLAQAGYSVCLLERRVFPRETLCGEFLSHEVMDIISDYGLVRGFLDLRPSPISRLVLCPDHGPMFSEQLGFTAYGLKRGTFDQFLLNAAKAQGVQILQPAEAESIIRRGSGFEVHCRMREGMHTLQARWCVGAYGKTSTLDRQLVRQFAGRRSGLNGIKFHIPSETLEGMNADEIRVFSGPRLYCGINHVEGGVATVCFLERRSGDDLSPRTRLKELAAANKHFARIMTTRAIAAIDKAPIYGTGNIFFGKRHLVENGIFMVGDAAQVISPLAGDGIGMALQSSQLLSSLFVEHIHKRPDPLRLEAEYRARWKRMFSSRVRVAAALQHVMLSTPLRSIGSTLLGFSPSLLRAAIARTRSTPR
jgi:menaquinone-9 beta-reductase